MKKTNDAGTGLVPDQADDVWHFFGPVPDWNYECRTADTGVSMLDAAAQLCYVINQATIRGVSGGTADVVDVVYVNIVTWSIGVWGGWSGKGWTVDSKPGTRVDGYSRHNKKAGSPSK